MTKKVLVTGAAGFIGSHVAQHCRDFGYEVLGIDDLSGGFVENIPEGIRFEKIDVTEFECLSEFWKTSGPFDYVYHLAAYAAEGLSHFIRRYNYRNNLLGSVNLINLSVLNSVQCFVFTSSIAVYGLQQNPVTEEMLPTPEDPYGISKYAVELDLKAASRLFNLPFIVFRPHNVYGERQNIADKYRNVIGIFINQLLRGQPMTIFGDGEQTRAFSNIDDVAPIIAAAPQVESAYGETFNIGADLPYTVNELARRVAAAVGVEPRIEYLPARSEIQHAYASHEKARRVFKTEKSPVSLNDGLQRMVEWAKIRGSMKPVEFQNIEVAIHLPQSWRRKGIQ